MRDRTRSAQREVLLRLEIVAAVEGDRLAEIGSGSARRTDIVRQYRGHARKCVKGLLRDQRTRANLRSLREGIRSIQGAGVAQNEGVGCERRIIAREGGSTRAEPQAPASEGVLHGSRGRLESTAPFFGRL